MNIRKAPYGLAGVLAALAACAGTPRENGARSGLVFLDREGRIGLVAEKLEVSSHRLENREGRIGYFVEVTNLSSEACRVRLNVRFFDSEGATEYERVPVVLDAVMTGGEAKRIEGVLDFGKLPERSKIAKMGISVTVEGP